MNTLNLVLISPNAHYMERFDRYVRMSSWRDEIRVHRFTTIDSYRSSEMTDLHMSDKIVLVDDTIFRSAGDNEELLRGAVRFVQDPLLLSESRGVWMYQPVSQIIATLRSIGNHDASGVFARRKGDGGGPSTLKIIGVISPYGGSGVSTVACHLARLAAMRQSKVLYVHLDLYPEPLIVPDGVIYDLSRLLYKLTTRPEEIETEWQHYCGLHPASGIYGLRMPSIRRDMRDITKDHINELCHLFGRTGFSTIVLDLDAHWLDDVTEEQLVYDECWFVSPWKKRYLAEYPSLRQFVRKNNVRYIVNGYRRPDYKVHDDEEPDIDAILPWIEGGEESADPWLPDERVDMILSRLLRESGVLEGGEDVG